MLYLDRVPAGLKLLGLIALSSVLILMEKLTWLAPITAFIFVIWYVTRPNLPWFWGKIWPLWLTFALFFLYIAWVVGLQEGAVTLCRLLALWAAAQIVLLTTSTTAMMKVVEQVATPFARIFNANPTRIALLFGLTIRSIPLLVQQWQEVREAQLARGVKVKVHNVLVPMLVRTLARADALTDAIDARQLDADTRC